MSSPAAPIPFANTYARLPQRFYARVDPTPVAAPRLIQLNTALAAALGIDPEALATPEGVAILAGNRIAAGSEPLAIAYAGHQFGHFVPQLGDGRANLLGEVLVRDIQRYDIQLKGSGPTPFSRRGDGRAALGPVLREYLVSEAMHALGVPTTRALAAVTTGQTVVRDTVQPGAIFTRVAASHIRVGTFQYFAARGDTDGVRTLADYAIARHYSQTAGPDAAHAATPYRALLDAVVARQAALIAQWLCLGFIHGVMNTDNMAISGETIDYGPCAFMEAYDPDQVFSSIDVNGRYAYANQPSIALWNLTLLAECLLPLLETEAGSKEAALDSAKASLAAFQPQLEAAHLAALRRKFGLLTEREGDEALIAGLFDRMAANHADFTLTFHRLADECASRPDPPKPGAPFMQSHRMGGPAGARRGEVAGARMGEVAGAPFMQSHRMGGPAATASESPRTLFTDPAAFDTWATDWRARLALEPAPPEHIAATMRLANPAFIPRNHLVQAVIDAAVLRDDFAPFRELLHVVAHPYGLESESDEDRLDLAHYLTPALPSERVTQTFCGT